MVALAGCAALPGRTTAPAPAPPAQVAAATAAEPEKADGRAQLRARLAALLVLPEGAPGDYRGALGELELYLADHPGERDEDEMRSLVALLHRVLRVTADLEALQRRAAAQTPPPPDQEKAARLAQANRDLRAETERLGRENRDLRAELERLARESKELKVTVERLKALDMDMEQKRRSVR